MLKRNLKIPIVILLLAVLLVPVYITLVSSSSGYIRINSTSTSVPNQEVLAGENVNLYFGDVTWDASEFYLLLSHDGTSEVSAGDSVYSPKFSVYDVATTGSYVTYTADNGYWKVGDNWINGTLPSTVPVGNYTVKAFDVIANVAVTDAFITVYTSVHDSTLEISPSSGPGGVPVQFTGSGYGNNAAVTLLYYDPTFGLWYPWANTTSNSSGHILVNSVMPDLGKSVGVGDWSETYAAVSFKTQVGGIDYSYADYNQYSRGLKTIGSETASGLFGNGTNLSSSVKVKPGDILTISGKWFYYNDVIYVKWDSESIVGTVTSDEWSAMGPLNSTIADSDGSFEISITIPEASGGEHYIAVEDSEARVIFKISLSRGTLQISPSSGPGGASVQFTGSGYLPATTVDLLYLDPAYGTWNSLGSVTSTAQGSITYTTEMPDLGQSLWSGDNSENYDILSFRTEIGGNVYCTADYYQYMRGIKRVGSAIANGLYGDATDLVSTVEVNAGDSITISGKWFHPGDAIYVRWDGTTVVGTLTGSEWLEANIIGTSIAGSSGSFETTVTIPTADVGEHRIAIEDSETRITLKINLESSPTPSPTPTPTPEPSPSPTPDPAKATPTLGVSCKGTAISATDFKVDISGKLSHNGAAISGETVLISYSDTGGDNWKSLTSVNTGSDGSFAAVWTPQATGDYKVKASWAGNSVYNPASTTVNLVLKPYSEETVFSLNSNSTITEFAFNSTTKTLSFTASGPQYSKGYVTLYIPKTLITDISELQVYFDGTQIAYSSESQTDAWVLSFTYSHSSHKVVIDLSAASDTNETQTPDITTYLAITAAAIIIVVVAVTITFKRKRKQ